MVRVIATARIKTTLTQNLPPATDAELTKGKEVLMYREKPLAEWAGPYVLNKRDEKL